MKGLVLSSGGVDSTTCLGIAIDKYGVKNVSAVSIFYGQKHKKELEQAKKIAQHYGVNHYVLDLSEIFKSSNCALLSSSNQSVSHKSYAEQIADNGMVNTYVPFRNGLMLSSVASLAMSIYSNDEIEIFIGAHADDATGNAYADCSIEFVNAISEAIRIGTYQKVNIVAPLVNKNKTQVVEMGLRLNVPYGLTWSCYEGGNKPCGVCATCRDRAVAFSENGVIDPAIK